MRKKSFYFQFMAKLKDNELATKLERLSDQLLALAEEIRGGAMKIPSDIQRRFDEFRKAHRCLHCGQSLGEDTVKRGLHAGCYAVLMQRINRGQGTEREFVLEGRMAVGQKGGRKRDPLPELPVLQTPAQITTAGHKIVNTVNRETAATRRASKSAVEK